MPSSFARPAISWPGPCPDVQWPAYGRTGRQLAEEDGAWLENFHGNFRFQPWHREIKRQIDAGGIGHRLHSLTFRSRMGDGWGEDAYISRQPYFRDYPRFVVFESGVHFIDTFRFLAGEIARVSAWLRRLNPVIKGEDSALVIFEFVSGALGQWDASRYNEANCPDPRYTFGEFLVEGNGGSLRLGLDGRLSLQKLGSPEQEIRYRHEPRGFCADCCYFTQRHFVDCLLDGKPFETDGREYLKTLTVQEAVYRSAEGRTPVLVSLKDYLGARILGSAARSVGAFRVFDGPL